MKVVAIIQVRMSSTRLPGKVMMKISDKPLLWYVIDRLRKAAKITDIVIATSISSSDDVIVKFCMANKIKFFRGDLENVLKRYLEASFKYNADVIVRVTSDCPLIDGSLIDKGVSKFIKYNYDYLSNTINRTFPRGFDFEIVKFHALKTAFENAKEMPELEHVTPYIWRNHPEKFKIGQLRRKVNKSSYRITVDTREDFQVVKVLINKYKANKKNAEEIIRILDKHPEICAVNQMVEQKKYGQYI